MRTKLITAIKIRKLFGIYSYNLPEEESLTNAAILYGENGIGKSTLLRLVFHLLSASNARGHRTALLDTEFESLEVHLDSGITLDATRLYFESYRFIRLTIKESGVVKVYWDHFANDLEHYLAESELVRKYSLLGGWNEKAEPIRRQIGPTVDAPQGSDAYLTMLRTRAPEMFILNAERRLDSDVLSDEDLQTRRLMSADGTKSLHELVAKSRGISLSQAMTTAAQWIRNKAIKGANLGSVNVHSVYVEILKHLSSPSDHTLSLKERLKAVREKTAKHAVYELATKLSITEFEKALSSNNASSDLAESLLQPYVTSLERRLDAVEPIYKIIDKFVTLINEFLKDKLISYTLSKGFLITNVLGNQLEPRNLSSGEQQLLLLFCYVLTARDSASVFMIDEPEISLNVKWQRKLVGALLEVSDGADIQFIFASHSLELLAQHRSRVVQLKRIV